MKKPFISVTILLTVLVMSISHQSAAGQSGKDAVLTIKKTGDFTLSGDGSAENWSKTEWVDLNQLSLKNHVPGLATRAKILYSDTGMYFLFECRDQVLNATMTSDFMKLWNEDVVEVFLWPDESTPTYFEYELSPLNFELVLLISNGPDDFASWRPFGYEGSNRQTRHKTSVTGGKKESGASVKKWTAELFIPYKLLRPLNNLPPEPGTRWRANLYRIDYDSGQTLIAWQPTNGSFHEYKKFGTFLFE